MHLVIIVIVPILPLVKCRITEFRHGILDMLLNSWKEFYCSDNGLYKVYGTTGSTSVRLRVYTLTLNKSYVNLDVAR